jgi:hypothetical protein
MYSLKKKKRVVGSTVISGDIVEMVVLMDENGGSASIRLGDQNRVQRYKKSTANRPTLKG